MESQSNCMTGALMKDFTKEKTHKQAVKRQVKILLSGRAGDRFHVKTT